MQEKLSKIKKEDIELYLRIWGYDGIEFEGSTPVVSGLKEIFSPCPDDSVGEAVLVVADQNENSIEDSARYSYGAGQLLYELEVFADMPEEIRGTVSEDGWTDFIVRFIRLYREKGWGVYFSKQMPLTDRVSGKCSGETDFDKLKNEDVPNQGYMILQNGNGGKIQAFYEGHKSGERIEVLRLIVLFRAYIMELLCGYFKVQLQSKDVDLFVVNWNWALMHPLYPQEKITSADIEGREKYSVSQIVNNEAQYRAFLEDIYGTMYSLDYVREVMDIPNRLKIGKGNVEHEDRFGSFLNVSQGERRTEDQLTEYDHTVYLLGGCVFFGYAVEDAKTIASCLQRCLNREFPEQKWRVVNYGTWGGDIDWTYQRFYQIAFQPGDIVFVSYAGLMPLGLDWEKRDISTCLKKIQTEKQFYFNSIVHCNHLGYELVARGMLEMFFSCFIGQRSSGEVFFLKGIRHQKKNYEEQLAEYVDSIKSDLPELVDKNVGAIVMNCNPFTLGHQYLIEYASQRVEVLIIFVVEENKSYFPFEDRIQLVRLGTRHLQNVYVVPSGKLIISTATFPGYFLKDTPEAVGVDTSLDVSVFGEYIAKAFHIKSRFVGEEPLDIVTNNYNESMKRILPRFGIEVVVIPRKEKGGNVISASRVRKYLGEGDFEGIKELVPESTYLYLCDKFGGI